MDKVVTFNDIFDFQKTNEQLFIELDKTLTYINAQFKSISKNEYNNKKLHCFEDLMFTNPNKSKVQTSPSFIIIDLLTDFYDDYITSSKFNITNRSYFSKSDFDFSSTYSLIKSDFYYIEKTIAFSSILFYIKFNTDIYKHLNLNELKDFFNFKYLDLGFPNANFWGENSFKNYSNNIYTRNLINYENNTYISTFHSINHLTDIKKLLKYGCKLSLKSDLLIYQEQSIEYNFFKLFTSNNDLLSNFNDNTQKELQKIIDDILPKSNASYDLSNKLAIKIFESTLPKKITKKYYNDTLKIIIEKTQNKNLSKNELHSIFFSLILKKYSFDTINSLKYFDDYLFDFISDYFSENSSNLLHNIKNLHSMDINLIFKIICEHLTSSITNPSNVTYTLVAINEFPEDKRKELFNLLLDNEFFDSLYWEISDLETFKSSLASNDLNYFYKILYQHFSNLSFSYDWILFRGIPKDSLNTIKNNYFLSYAKKHVFFLYKKDKLTLGQFRKNYPDYNKSDQTETIYNIFLKTLNG